MKTLRRLAIGLAAVVGLLFVFGRPVTWAEAASVMWDLAAGGAPTPWQEMTDSPSEHPTRWDSGEGDLYLPAGKVRAAMVLVPGAAVLGRDEPRLRALARTFARAGFAVLVPELPEVRQLALSRADGGRVASALRQLGKRQPDVPLGVAAVSYAVGPAVIAMLEDDLTSRVAFLVSIGGYHDITAAIRFITTGAFRPMGDSREFRREPNRYGRWAFLQANAGRLENTDDTRLLQEIAQRRFRNADADIAPLSRALGPQGRAVLAVVDNRDPDAVAALIAALPDRVRQEIDGLNLALYDLSQLRGHIILVHGQGDPLVPYSESQSLAASASGARVSLFLIDDIGHVEFNAVSLGNAWAMWRAIVALLGERL
ncbi:MAG: alpha/beta hydrolase [Reyranella sp.]|uniref:alpha/beta hydrolase family protein n=1 Tax=Reyranella sp. TaxID=1929291 RepID=UPI00272F682F|nr:alpha/beta hydrolase [Reyranella sp.]MDP1962341.1 alpha/beta hydrolase [Reyranella sp.]MDP2376528.1 alpha/beta hydrolase [Reyranella sp.]